jgi:hypothetical protein
MSTEVEGWYDREVSTWRLFSATAWALALSMLLIIPTVYCLILIQVEQLNRLLLSAVIFFAYFHIGIFWGVPYALRNLEIYARGVEGSGIRRY